MARGLFVRWLLWGTGCLVGLGLLGSAAFLGGFALLSSIVRTPEVVVPSVYGRPEAEAIKTLVQSGLAIHFPIEYQESEQVEDGFVMEQSPRPHIRVKEGRRIRLTVSRGAKRIVIPNLVGSEESAILPGLQHVTLEVGQRATVYHETVEPGVIIAQSPPPGEALHYGKLISILVSLGPRPKAYVMPNKIGGDIEETKQEFIEMGFSVEVDRQEVSAPEDWDRILDQDPTPGAKLIEGSEVVFTVGARQVKPERVRALNIPIPESVTGKFVTVAVYEISDGRAGMPQTFKVPVTGASDEIRLSIPFQGKIVIRMYDGAVEGGTLLYSNTFQVLPETSVQEIEEW